MSGGFKKPDAPDITTLDSDLKKMGFYMTAMHIVVIVGFITLLATVAGIVIDAYRFKASSYEDLSGKINQLVEAKKNADLQNIQTQIDTLKTRNPYLK